RTPFRGWIVPRRFSLLGAGAQIAESVAAHLLAALSHPLRRLLLFHPAWPASRSGAERSERMGALWRDGFGHERRRRTAADRRISAAGYERSSAGARRSAAPNYGVPVRAGAWHRGAVQHLHLPAHQFLCAGRRDRDLVRDLVCRRRKRNHDLDFRPTLIRGVNAIGSQNVAALSRR